MFSVVTPGAPPGGRRRGARRRRRARRRPGADVDPAGCTPTLGYDPSIPTWDQYWAADADPDAVVPLGYGTRPAPAAAPRQRLRRPDAARPQPDARSSTSTGTRGRGDREQPARAEADQEVPRQVLLGRATSRSTSPARRENIANLDTAERRRRVLARCARRRHPDRGRPRGRGRAGPRSRGSRPPRTAASPPPRSRSRARCTSCWPARTARTPRRLKNLDVFLQPVRNPDGRDGVTRTTAFGFDHNRDFGTQNQIENKLMLPEINKYPGLFFIDAHQQASGYFFPPNEDPVHHEISHFALDFIQNGIGPALQRAFNDQSAQYQNYNSYDMFTPEYGDTVPSLIMGAAGMTYEKGNSEVYGKQVYDHYLAIDTTLNVTSERQGQPHLRVGPAVGRGRPSGRGLHAAAEQARQPAARHDQAAARGHRVRLLLQARPAHRRHGGADQAPPEHGREGVHARHAGGRQRLPRVRQLRPPAARRCRSTAQTLPAGTFYIPMEQGMKHWIQAVLGENPFIPYDYYYDVVTWSYPLQRGLSGSGFLTSRCPRASR